MGQMNREADGLARALEDTQKEDKDTFNALVEQEQQALLDRIRALEEELQKKRMQETGSKTTGGGVNKQLQKAEKIIKLVHEVSAYYGEEDSPRQAMTTEKVLKSQLHDVLRDTDSNYV